MAANPTAEFPVHRRVRAWWVDAVLLGVATLLAELALHEAVVLTPAPIPANIRGFIDAVGLVLIVSPLFAWTLYRRTVDAKYARIKTQQLKAPGSPHHRVRVAVLGSLSVFAAIVCVALWGNVKAAETLAYEGEISEVLTRLRLHGERIARFAGNAPLESIDAALLDDEMRRFEMDARQIAVLTASPAYERLPQANVIDSALARTAAAEAALRAGVQRLQGADSTGRQRSSIDVHQLADEYQMLVGLAVNTVQRVQRDDIMHTKRAAWGAVGLSLALLLGIALLVVEPVVRLLRRQHAAVTTKSLEFERLAMVAQRTSNAVVLTDEKRRITWANEGFTRLTGWSLDEVVGKSPGQVLQSPQTDPHTVARMRAALDRGDSIRTDVLNMTRTGESYWLDLSIEPLRVNGVLTGFVAVESDITEQVQAREALQREREALEHTTALLNEAQALARMGSWAFDLASEQVEWSPETFNLFGRDAELGTPDYEAVLAGYHPEDAVRLQEAVERAATTGEAYSLVLRTAGRNPMVRWVRGEGRARRAADRSIIGLYGTVMDVTEAIEREEALRHAQARAEAANRSKSEFLANMSHEIRTPLTAILGYTDLLREENQRTAGTGSDHGQALDTIRRAGEHLLTVINDILDISKIEAGKLEIEQVNTALPSVLLDVESLMRARAQAKGVALENRLVTPVPDRIMTDPTRLRQILMNLVGNAAKFTERGRILVETGVERSHGEDMLVIAIDDTGPGMSEEQAAQLFQPFTQGDTSVTRRHGGTGLGLTISRRLAELMGGEVELVQTALGRGSRFELRLPVRAADEARHVARLDAAVTHHVLPEAAPSALAGRRVLLAEDGEDNQRLISVLLKAAGAEVTVVSNGRQALETLEWAQAGGGAFDLLLTDMQMPEMDGYTLASTLRGSGSAIPIIALTAHAMAEDRQKCLDAGCDDYATKPIDRRALISTCARWVSRLEVFPTLPIGESEPGAEATLEGIPDYIVSDLLEDPDLAELANGFAEALPARVQAIADCVEQGDRESAARLIHQLKGAAGSYGFPIVSDVTRQLEYAISDDLLGDARQQLVRLHAYAEAARRGLAMQSGAAS